MSSVVGLGTPKASYTDPVVFDIPAGNDVDYPVGSVFAELPRIGTCTDLDVVDHVEGHRDIVQGVGFAQHAVHPLPVQEDQYTLRTTSAHVHLTERLHRTAALHRSVQGLGQHPGKGLGSTGFDLLAGDDFRSSQFRKVGRHFFVFEQSDLFGRRRRSRKSIGRRGFLSENLQGYPHANTESE